MYTCPMHPEVRVDKSGACPKCGMPLEPAVPMAQEGQEHKALQALSRKFWIGLVLAVPVIGNSLRLRNLKL